MHTVMEELQVTPHHKEVMMTDLIAVAEAHMVNKNKLIIKVLVGVNRYISGVIPLDKVFRTSFSKYFI